MRRAGIAAVAAAILVTALYALVFAGGEAAPDVRIPQPAAKIGSGEDAVAVGAEGTLIGWFPADATESLPSLPLTDAPESGRVGGAVLAQVEVLAAAPPALQPFVERSYMGESGIDVVLRNGIELRFGDATEAERKWKAAAAVLANPAITSADYVNVISPQRPGVYGSGHTLPPLP